MEKLYTKQVYQPSVRSFFKDQHHIDVTPHIRGKLYQPSLLKKPKLKLSRSINKNTKHGKKSKIIKDKSKKKLKLKHKK